MRNALTALFVVLSAGLANAETAIDGETANCASVATYGSSPELLTPEAGEFVNGMLTALTATGYGDRPTLIQRIGEACSADPTFDVVSAVRTMLRN
jgi:hypothetical protein